MYFLRILAKCWSILEQPILLKKIEKKKDTKSYIDQSVRNHKHIYPMHH